MQLSIPVLLSLAAALPGALAHGYLKEIITGGQTYTGWAPFSDPYISPAPVRYTRAYPGNGPVPDFTTDDITCNQGGNIPIAYNIPVTAGSQVKFQWVCLPREWRSAGDAGNAMDNEEDGTLTLP
jgi:cellulase